MPTTYAHYRFGCDALVSMPEELQAIVNANRELYDFGVHGPDLLFYHNALVKDRVNQLGYATHRMNGRDVFRKAAKVVNASSRRDAALSYALGYLCHFALDRCSHPYVEEKTGDGVSHNLIEASFDRYLMLMDDRTPAEDKVTGHLHPNDLTALVISEFFPPLTGSEIFSAQRSMVFILDFLSMKPGLKRSAIDRALGIDPLTGFGDMFVRLEDVPECADSDLKLMECYVNALEMMQTMVPEFLSCMENSTPLGDCFDHTFGAE